MSMITMLGKVLEESATKFEKLKAGEFTCVEQWQGDKPKTTGNILAHGDNLSFMKYLADTEAMKGKINLVYIDPPFFSKAAYDGSVAVDSPEAEIKANIKVAAYNDCWETGLQEYLCMLALRLFAIRELLSDEGCIWLHLDWHVVHYAKLLMDEIFGERNFVNEVIWTYKSGGSGKKSFAKKHDTLLFYSKSEKYYFKPLTEKSYNRGFKPYRFKGVKEYQDEMGWYTMVNMKDVWAIDMVGRTSKERTGYATQKPEALLERIILSCSKEGDICADFFGGSGTLASIAQKHNRKWISCDMGEFAIAGQQLRMLKLESEFRLLREKNMVLPGKDIASVQIELLKNEGGVWGVALKSYGFNNNEIDRVASEEDVAMVRMLAENNYMKLIGFWSVDFNYDGVCHNPHKCAYGENMSSVIENAYPAGECISIHVADIFGNRTEKNIYNK